MVVVRHMEENRTLACVRRLAEFAVQAYHEPVGCSSQIYADAQACIYPMHSRSRTETGLARMQFRDSEVRGNLPAQIKKEQVFGLFLFDFLFIYIVSILKQWITHPPLGWIVCAGFGQR
jgi:hypothetical protein